MYQALALVAAPFVGSFLGTVVLRLPQELPVLAGRSRCDSCEVILPARTLVPVLSWLALRGRCHACGAELGTFYPAIELAALAVALSAVPLLPGDAPLLILASLVLGWALLAIAWIDAVHLYIPDVLVLPLVATGLATIAVLELPALVGNVIGAALGFGAFAGLGWLYERVRGRPGLGLGDAKLLAAAGAWLGWKGLATVVLVASIAGIVTALIVARGAKSLNATEPFPFAPGLCLGIWVVWLLGPLVAG